MLLGGLQPALGDTRTELSPKYTVRSLGQDEAEPLLRQQGRACRQEQAVAAAWAFTQMEAAVSGLGASAAEVTAAGSKLGMSIGPATHATHPAAESNGAAGESPGVGFFAHCRMFCVLSARKLLRAVLACLCFVSPKLLRAVLACLDARRGDQLQAACPAEAASALACLFWMLCSINSLPEASGPCSTESYGLWRPYMASVLRNQRITAPDHFQDTRHIELDLGRSGIAYDPGDLLTIFPRQPSTAVQGFIQCSGLDGSAWVEITPCEVPPGMAQRPSMQVG